MNEDQVVQRPTIAGETIVTTPNHPFYTSAQAWIPAGELHPGDLVRRADGTYGTVEATTFVYAPQPMYNLTVATAHTYFVGDGQWLVHNTCFDWKRADHIFRDAPGHVNPPTQASRQRFAELFESVAQDSSNYRPGFPLPSDAQSAGVQAFTKAQRNGEQVWVYVRNNKILDAGINPPGAHR